MSIKFLEEIVNQNGKPFSTTTLYDMLEVVQPLYSGSLYLVPRDGFEQITSQHPDVKMAVIPEDVSIIPDNAFSKFGYLEYIIVPKSVTSIEHFGHGDLSDELTILFYGSQEDWDNVTKDTNHTYFTPKGEFPVCIRVQGTNPND